jgi:hypothetical protein
MMRKTLRKKAKWVLNNCDLEHGEREVLEDVITAPIGPVSSVNESIALGIVRREAEKRNGR